MKFKKTKPNSSHKMATSQATQLPIKLGKARKSDMRTQFAALAYRIKNDKIQILLVTSRTRGRWIIPKGWPMLGETPADAAATEAWEEAGVKGKTSDQCLGVYSYFKDRGESRKLPCLVMVYPIKVKKLSNDYPEVHERRRKWVSRKKAAKMVQEKELAKLIATFDPRTKH